VPRWILVRPFLFAGLLRWRNAHRRHRALVPIAAAVSVIGGGLMAFPAIGRVLELAARYPFALFAFWAAIATMSAVRRKTSIHNDLVDSWLAPLAAPSSVALRVTLAPALQLLLIGAALSICVLAGSLTYGEKTNWPL
jgi:hypothetical protein